MADPTEIYDMLCVGAGPANLAFAASVQSAQQKILIIEMGKSLAERNSNLPADVGSGVAGAGSYIDGRCYYYLKKHEYNFKFRKIFIFSRGNKCLEDTVSHIAFCLCRAVGFVGEFYAQRFTTANIAIGKKDSGK